MISYAQNFEDVMIARLFDSDYRGFYVDIGAAHPEYLSVTRHFYGQGWSGINVEPASHFYPLLRQDRPRDINLQCAISNNPGVATFYEIPMFAENSTLEADVADRLVTAGLVSEPHKVEVLRLAYLCDIHVKDRTIDFMKIDVEGSELGVLESGDWERYRPRLLIVEATAVNTREENWQDWEPILIKANYHKVWFDGLNNFYLREEDIELRHVFRLPPNVFDGFEAAELAGLKQLLAERESDVSGLKQLLAERESDVSGLKQLLAERESEFSSLKQLLAEQESQIKALFSRRSVRWFNRIVDWPEFKKLAEWSNVHH